MEVFHILMMEITNKYETFIHEQNFIIPKNRPVWGDFFVLYYLELLICVAGQKMTKKYKSLFYADLCHIDVCESY